MAKIEHITKKFSKSVNRDRQIWSFSTELGATVEVSSKEELLKESAKLFDQARALTELDIKKAEVEWTPPSA